MSKKDPDENINRAKRLLKKPSKRTVLGIMLSVLMIPLFALLFYVFGIIFTYTGSIPVGFYRIISDTTQIKRGDYVSFCLPDTIAKMGLERGYIHRGSCANGSEELIKQVIAVPGDTVKLANNEISVNGLFLGSGYFAPTRIIDKDHLPVYRFIKEGTYQAKGYWVYGFGDPRYSWDSRYYGGIPKANIKHRLLPLWIF
ncbi:MAG: conjugative transfer signal peptidase TraF [Gammaproteobacteria bacterium CG11_big_fil_rev_8_21_14_0_20_46_22]|nr:MAG: conjugative transfer signal peptidase TraF [Gammaproteobacteria bacterium CG11_big_fil_rev_8_21_14_0_20_46_22]